MSQLKITVVKKVNTNDLFGNNPPLTAKENRMTPECDRFKTGQEFILDNIDCPPGFCTWAFADIQRDIAHLFFRGNYPWVKEKGATLACCTDGFRPVIFKIERIED
ncbi:MAG: TIGR04076 family protein [Deltaproteobacteria bacterium]|nr:TIGR04076 family protein [Deltaproteobacteria bacterium]